MAARRVRVPAADDIFRPTAPASATEAATGSTPGTTAGTTTAGNATSSGSTTRKRGTSGRVRHDEKMTVYVTSDELLELEHARLTLRSRHGVALDRGRLVREAIAIALADLEARGEDSILVRRLAQPADEE